MFVWKFCWVRTKTWWVRLGFLDTKSKWNVETSVVGKRFSLKVIFKSWKTQNTSFYYLIEKWLEKHLLKITEILSEMSYLQNFAELLSFKIRFQNRVQKPKNITLDIFNRYKKMPLFERFCGSFIKMKGF